jgi:hypothetical protein
MVSGRHEDVATFRHGRFSFGGRRSLHGVQILPVLAVLPSGQETAPGAFREHQEERLLSYDKPREAT